MKAHFSPVDADILSKLMEALEPQTLFPSGLEHGELSGLKDDIYRPLVIYFDFVLEAYCSTSPPLAPEPLLQFYNDP